MVYCGCDHFWKHSNIHPSLACPHTSESAAFCFKRVPFSSISKVIGLPSRETSDVIRAESGADIFIVERVLTILSPIFGSPSNVQVSPSTLPFATPLHPTLLNSFNL